MEPQTVINILIGLVASVGGWWCKTMWDTISELQKKDTALAREVAEVKILVAGAYIKRDEFSTAVTALFRKLDKIDDKLDKKADKQNGLQS